MIQGRIQHSHTTHKHAPRGHGIPCYCDAKGKGKDCSDAPEVWSPPCGCVDVEGSRARFEPILIYRGCLSRRNLPCSAIEKYTVCQLQRETQRKCRQAEKRRRSRRGDERRRCHVFLAPVSSRRHETWPEGKLTRKLLGHRLRLA